MLTSGGDCPGLNAVLRAVVRTAIGRFGWECAGIRNGWKGLLDDEVVPLSSDAVAGLLFRGGTILGSSRLNPVQDQATSRTLLRKNREQALDAIIEIGGNGSLSGAHGMAEMGCPIVGVPKTIDNDIVGTDVTFGFHTAVQIVTDAIDRLHTTAESHNRIIVVETMGRNTGWIALESGLAGGADVILIPEQPFDYDDICALLQKRHQRRNYSIIVAAEGAMPAGGDSVTTGEVDEVGRQQLGGIGHVIADQIERRLGIDARVTVLGYVQRGGTPVAYDRLLATRFGANAVTAVAEKRFDHFTALHGSRIELVPLSEMAGKVKTVPPESYALATTFFG